jgi:hypothetical protein
MTNCTPSRPEDRAGSTCKIVVCSDISRIAAAAAGILGLMSCQVAPETPTTFPVHAYRAEAPGDWEDIDAAVEIGAGQAEWVISNWWYEGAAARLYKLRNPLGTEALLRIRRTREDGPLEITATVGPFGDAAAEGRIVERVSRRLGQLHGVDAAEIR